MWVYLEAQNTKLRGTFTRFVVGVWFWGTREVQSKDKLITELRLGVQN